MTLTTSFQKIGTGTQKTYGGSAGYLELWAKINSQDIPNNKTNVTVELRLVVPYGYIGNYQATYWNITGSLSNNGNLGSGDYRSRTLGSATGDIQHNQDGTKSISFSGSFNPTAWGIVIDVNGSANLPTLHTPPKITSYTTTETNSTLSGLGITNQIVNLLSVKRFVLSLTYDDATLSNIKVYDGNGNQVGTSTTTTINCTFSNNLVNGNITFEITDSKGGVSNTTYTLPFIAYTRPTLEPSSTKAVRNSTASGGITAGYVDLIVKGSYYYANNAVGLHTTISTIQYKIWEENTTEPSSYSTLTGATISGGNVSKTQTISNINFQKKFNYKFIITDNYGKSSDIINGILPTGISVWDEEEDHVNFLEITKDEKPVHSYNVLFEGTPTKTPTLSDNVSNYELLLVLAGVGDGTVEAQVYPVLKYSNKFGANWKIIATERFYTNVSFTASGTSATLTVREVFGWDASVVKIFKIVGYK